MIDGLKIETDSFGGYAVKQTDGTVRYSTGDKADAEKVLTTLTKYGTKR